jgi:hypothetical protein
MVSATPSDYAAEELAMWEQALREQRSAEDELKAARRSGPPPRVFELLPQVDALRTRADLLLAEAVKVKCTFRDHRTRGAWAGTTQPGEVQ